MNEKGWREKADGSGKAPRHKEVARKGKLKDTLRTPMAPHGNTTRFKKDISKFLTQLAKKNPQDTTIPELRRWLKEDLMPFEDKSAHEQVAEKIDYEKDIGNDSPVFRSIEKFLNDWLKENIGAQDTHIWYHGTTEDKYRKIMETGAIKVSTAQTAQHEGFAHDIGTISLAKYKGMAHFFSGISNTKDQNQIVLHIDTRKLDPSAMKKRTLITSPEAEMLYSKDIPVSAIVKAETVYVAEKQDEKEPLQNSKFETVYRGEGATSKKGGSYWSPSMEWAKQFTQTGRVSEVNKAFVRSDQIYTAKELPYAGDTFERDAAIATAKTQGFKAVRLSEGQNEPPSVYVFDKSALKSITKLQEEVL